MCIRDRIMTGLTLLFAAFGLMTLLVLVIWAVDAQYRLHVMIATTVVLLLAAAIVGILTLRKAGQKIEGVALVGLIVVLLSVLSIQRALTKKAP